MNDSSIRFPIFLIILFFVGMGVIAFLFITAEDATVGVDIEQVEITEPINVNQQEIVPVTTVLAKDGSSIVLRDFWLDEDVELIDEQAEVYMIGSEPGPEGTLFEIFYFKGGGGGITISLLTPDLAFARGRAEEVLQERLDVSLLRLCALKVAVTVPRTISPVFTGEDYSGIDLGLPSCPGSFVF